MHDLLIPPLSFSRVDTGIYRSAYPSTKSLPFIQSLHLKTAICLNPSDLRDELKEFAAANGIQLVAIDVGWNQEPFMVMSDMAVSQVVDKVLNPDQQPVLIFDTNGKVRCSCVVGCIRKYSGWSLSSIFQEFEQFAEPEGGVADMLFIENHGEPNA